MSASSKDVFRLDPPQRFAYTDFVIRAPLPRLPPGMPAETAMRKYPRTRLKRLIKVVEARLGRRRCFFSECQPRDQKKESQFAISKLYAMYEVGHWPGALAQYDWTQFVMANIERDALRNEYGQSVKLTLPMLPASAVPIYQEMLRQENSDSARIDVNSGHIAGVMFKGQVRSYPEEDSSRQPRRESPDQPHGLVRTPFVPPLSSSPNMRDALSELSSEQLQELVRDDQMFRTAYEYHQRVVQKELKQMYRFYLRCVCRQPGMHLFTWQEVVHEARTMIKLTFIQQLEKWRQQQPDIRFDIQDSTGTIVDLQLRYLISRVRHFDPIPAQASHQFRTELTRKHQIAAMLRQRRILREWTTAIAERSSVRDGERYRREGEHIMDMWTGAVEEYEAFNERNRKENVVLTAGMIPMASQLRVRASAAQVQTPGSGERQQWLQVGSSQPSPHSREQGESPMPTRGEGQEQPHTQLPPQMQAPGQDHTQEGLTIMEKALTEAQEQGQRAEHASSGQGLSQQQGHLQTAAAAQKQPPHEPYAPAPGLEQVHPEDHTRFVERMTLKALDIRSRLSLPSSSGGSKTDKGNMLTLH
ncbi:uncharacterized protein Z520_04195 [Fonsecaea multimorphosa CBS 102226]|uniref:Uncharacterized protein n=1 Tax=Fonsecaea multimorphosa CBS 102226 TaxID=1442371 RepID=A0A0D2KBM3_9EURO|nr:uncharacterized protein Z520_04195 [Fonsecaea multimorphosa CBS 102226]KIY00510.1 hypothetical protein Z520_04195 [Fonsecaea multimorphosa CBS 102226]OAL27027.1 hypothetical protein AYO22_03971 [Fonsecaea multimorphosa]